MYLRKNDKLVDVSCGYCSIPITRYLTASANSSRIKEKIGLNFFYLYQINILFFCIFKVGGSPLRTININ